MLGANSELTYGDIDKLSNTLASAIGRVGANERRVALRMERSPFALVAILGVLKADCAYVPVDPRYPRARQDYILADCAARLLLTDGDPAPGESVVADLGWVSVVARSTERTVALPDDAAYVIYTSGSSGAPKGCVVTHANVLSLLDGAGQVFSFGPDDVWTLFHSLSFDFSVWELWGALLSGGTVVVVPDEAKNDPRALLELLVRHGVTVLSQVPSVFGHLVEEVGRGEHHLSALRYIIFGGEAIVPADVIRWWDLSIAPGAEMVNMYGITETTVHVTSCRLDRELVAGARSGTPIGRPLPHLGVSLHDVDGRLVEPGQPGEMWVFGAGVCAGYLDRPKLTAERFPDDRSHYRSGDWAVQDGAGALYYLGRRDDQVKVGGFRIELGEVEEALRGVPGVRQAACAVERNAAGADQIVAYIVPDIPRPDGAEIRRRLSGEIPAHLVPNRVRWLARLPATPSGKLDRSLLAAAAAAYPLSAGQPMPGQGPDSRRRQCSPWEEVLCELFAQVLDQPAVSIDDDFFELGGHSLMAIRLVNRVRTVLGLEMAIQDLFQGRTVAGLVDRLAVDSSRPALRLRPRPTRIPLSFAQQRLWFLHQMHGENPAYHIPHALRLTGCLDGAALEMAIADVIARHEVLRTVFPDGDGGPVQRILPPEEAMPPLPVRWVSRDELDDAVRATALARFDLAADLPLRVALYALSPEEHVLVLVLHHIAGDGWSFGALSRDLSAAYTARLCGMDPDSTPLSVQYADYALWQRDWLLRSENVADQQLAFWIDALRDLPEELNLPFDNPRPAQASYRGGIVAIDLDPHLHAALIRLARATGATLHMVLQAAVAGVLARLGAGTDIPIGNAVAGRTDEALEDLVGFFVNTLVMRTDCAGDPTFAELVRRVRDGNVAAYAHQDLPFERLVEVLNPGRTAARHPLFQVMMAMQNNAPTDWDLPGLAVEMRPVYHDTAKFDMSFKLDEVRGPDGEPLGISGVLEYSRDLFEPTSAARIVSCITRFLSVVAEHPDMRLSRIDILSVAERHQLLVGWNATDAPYPTGLTVAGLFERRVDEAPDAVAVVQGQVRWNYRQLDERANRIGHLLAGLGAGPGTQVAIHLHRTPELIAALLGVWKAGAAYVPLDPDYPAHRLEFMFRDSGATVLVTEEALADRLDLAGVATISLDGDARLSAMPATRPVAAATGDNLAYLIYTSGSTGTPKSVMIAHGGVVNRLHDIVSRFKLTPEDVSLQLISIGFEPPVREIFAPLAAGGSVALLPPESPRDPATVVDAIRVYRPTLILCIVPSMLEAVLAEPAGDDDFRSLRLVATGGEVLGPGLASKLIDSWDCELVNQYGPTETTMMTCIHAVRAEDLAGRIPIGRPLANSRVFVLDLYLNPLPVGVSGETYLAGPGIGRGYVDRPGLTATSFVANPFGAPGERLYRSGDLCRWRDNGTLEFLGRVDDQVKIRGYRIELGEVEAVLREQPGVAQAAVVVREDRPGDRRLAGYLVPAAGSAPVVEAIRGELARRLPEHMVPAALVVLDALPLRGNGKLDRGRLPAPRPATLTTGHASRSPRTPIQEVLCELFAEVLGVPAIGVDDDFFRLGGHSLLAAQLMSRVRATLGIELTMRSFFEAPTVAGLAGRSGVDGTEDALEVLLPLRPRGHQTPLFCVHPGGGLSWCYAGLMRYLDADRPIYGVQARGLLRPDDMPATIEEMADDYVRRVRSVCVAGPYNLLGWSFGGIVAHEMAVRLRAEGARVNVLAMLDCYPGVPDYYRVDERDLFMSLLDPMRPGGIPGAGTPEIAAAVEILRTETGALSGLAEDQLVSLLRTMAHNRGLVTGFRPRHFDGDALFFMATLGRTDSAPPPNVWRDHIGGSLAVYPVESTHMDMSQPEPLAAIGRVLAARLEGDGS